RATDDRRSRKALRGRGFCLGGRRLTSYGPTAGSTPAKKIRRGVLTLILIAPSTDHRRSATVALEEARHDRTRTQGAGEESGKDSCEEAPAQEGPGQEGARQEGARQEDRR